MKVAIFSTRSFEKPFLEEANQSHHHELHFLDTRLTEKTASIAVAYPAVSCAVTDVLSKKVLAELAQGTTRIILLRSAGFNHVDLDAARALALTVSRVPAYSPYAIAEFAAGLILTLNRKIHRAYARVQRHNFLLDGLLGFDLYNRTVGIIGTGNIGSAFAKIMHGFGCQLLAVDPIPNPLCKQLGVRYTTNIELYRQADIISLHCPLTVNSYHLINEQALSQMKPGVMLINTGRGALIDTRAVISALKNYQIGYLGLDVYENEEVLFSQNLADTIIQDDIFVRLQAFPNVLITAHQAFLTHEALSNIAKITLENLTDFEQNKPVPHIN